MYISKYNPGVLINVDIVLGENGIDQRLMDYGHGKCSAFYESSKMFDIERYNANNSRSKAEYLDSVGKSFRE